MKKHITYLLILTITTFFGCEEAAESPYPDISFEQKSGLPIGGRSTAVAFVIADKAYVALGRSSRYGAGMRSCYEYNPETDAWTEKAAFAGTGRVNAIAEVVNGKAYVGLGFDPTKKVYSDSSILTDFWSFDPQTNVWEQKSSFPPDSLGYVVPVNSCSSFVIDSCIYVAANFNARGFSNQFWKYDTTNDTWTRMERNLPSMSTGAVACNNGKRYFYGTGYVTVNDNSWFEYLPAEDKFVEKKNMPDDGRLNGVALSVDDRFFVATGRYFGGTLTGGHVKSDVMEYDAIRNVWYNRGDIPGGGRENAISFVIGNKAYIGFGENDTAICNDLWCFEP